MTSLEHDSAEHNLNRPSSTFWSGKENSASEDEGERNSVEEVGASGVGIVAAHDADTDDGEGKGEGSTREEPEREEPEGVDIIVISDDSGNERGNGHENENESGREGVESDLSRSHLFSSSDESVAADPGFRRRRSGSESLSRSGSVSGSPSASPSQSRSSIKEALEMGKSSTATSWTQAERPSGDSERLPNADCPGRGDVVDTGRGEGRALSRVRADGGELSRKEEVLLVQEEDIAEVWDPLRYEGKTRSPGRRDGSEEREKEEDVGSVHALDSIHGGDLSMETGEKDRWRSFGSSSGRRNARQLRLEFQPPSPQPWDENDTHAENNETYMSDYYSTLNSKKFGTLQKSRQRPLIPHSSYYFGPPPPDSAYGTPPVGRLGVHHPREVVRVERDYAGGELVQFSPIFPLELEGRITPTQFLQTINDINEILISAHSIQRAFVDNFLAVITFQLSSLIVRSHYTKEMRRLKRTIDELNTQLYNPVGLNILWPQKVAFLFLEIEYY